MLLVIFCAINFAEAVAVEQWEGIIPALTYNSTYYNGTPDNGTQITIVWFTMKNFVAGRMGSVTMAIQDYREHGGVPNVTFR